MILRFHKTLLPVILFLSTPTLQSTVEPFQLTAFLGAEETYELKSKVTLTNDVEIVFKEQSYVDIITPLKFEATTQRGTIRLRGVHVGSAQELKPQNCTSANNDDCTVIMSDFYLTVSVLKSSLIDALVMIVGWAYFTAWSVSFYPQVVLNYNRKSVVGLNFDFLLFNLVGFAAYSIYNCFLFFDEHTQKIYEEMHPHSPIPVLLNDVFFATHAFLVCCFTAYQAFIYERGNQRVSYTCLGLTALMIVVACGAGVATWFNFINLLQFVTSLSYIKMAVTLFKYIPQALLNYRRKSTTGWSIGNVLLDFTGGCLDILQMVLQSWNASQWSAFYGNPVKFGLGLVSSSFDVLFIIQHYVLYPHKTSRTRTDPEKSDGHEMSGRSETERLSESLRNSTLKSTEKSSTRQSSSER